MMTMISSILLIEINAYAQVGGKDVTITASGSGKSQDESKQAALRSATEQAFGVFISSKTEIFNDKVVSDQMASVSSGNIKSYEVLNEAQLPDGRWGSTIKAIVSVDKLTSFVQAKGIAIEIQGGLFAINIKQQLLNEQGEFNVIGEMVGMLHEVMQTSFDYDVKNGDPKAVDMGSKNWEIPLEVAATANKNMEICASYAIKTLSSISLSSSEKDTYQSLNKQVFQVSVYYAGKNHDFYLRNKNSLNAIISFACNWPKYMRNFQLIEIGNEKGGKLDFEMKESFTKSISEKESLNKLYYPSAGEKFAEYSIVLKRSLSEIEKITAYKVRSYGVLSKFGYGGVIIKDPTSAGYFIGFAHDGNQTITIVQKESPADIADLKAGDKILSINGISVDNNLKELLGNAKSGGKKILLVVQKGLNGEKAEKVIRPIYQESSKGLVMSFCDIAYNTTTPDPTFKFWGNANQACKELVLNGYRDWYMPTSEEAKYIMQAYYFGLIQKDYWTCTENIKHSSPVFKAYNIVNPSNLGYGSESLFDAGNTHNLRPVRSF